MHKVNLFIVGAAKSGTTSLWKALGEHPDIYATKDMLHKEPAYFSDFGKKIGLSAYHRLFEGGSEHRYRLDASTAYLTSPESAERIYQYNPEARILIVLRNPIERAYSLYCWMTAAGYEWAPTFEKALEIEEARSNSTRPSFFMPQYYWNYMYKRSGNYSEQVERYINLFGKDVLLLSYHDLIESPETVINNTLSRLELAPLKRIRFTKENRSKSVYDSRLTFLTRKITRVLTRTRFKHFSTSMRNRDWLVRLTLKDSPPPPLREETRQILMEYYKPEINYFKSKYNISLVK